MDSATQFEGLLQKPARIIGRTTKVWCVLDGHSLMFFKENKRSSCIGHIDIADIQTIRKVGTKESQFQIITSEKPQIFTAESSELCKEWIKHIQHAMSSTGHEVPSGAAKSDHTERQTVNFNIDLKSVKDKWKQRESKKEETNRHTTPSPSYSPKKLSHFGFPFVKDGNQMTEHESKEQLPAAREESKEQLPIERKETKEQQPTVVRDVSKEPFSNTGVESKEQISITGDESKEQISITGDESKEQISITGDEIKEQLSITGDEAKEQISITGDEAKEQISITGDESREQISITAQLPIARDEGREQLLAARVNKPDDDSLTKHENKMTMNSDDDGNMKTETGDVNELIRHHSNVDQKKDETQVEIPVVVQSDTVKKVTKDDKLHVDTSQRDHKGISENKDAKTENKIDQSDTSIEEEPVVLRRKSRNVSGTNGRKTLDDKSQETVVHTLDDTSEKPCSVVENTTSYKTSSVVDSSTTDKTSSCVGNASSENTTTDKIAVEKPLVSVHETAGDTNISVQGETSSVSFTENDDKTPGDEVLLRKSASSNKETLNTFNTSNVSTATVRKTFPYSSETQGNKFDEDTVVLRPKSSSSKLATMTKCPPSSQGSNTGNDRNGGSVSGQEEVINMATENQFSQKVNGHSDDLPGDEMEDNLLFKVCKTEDIPSLECVKSDEMNAWEELRNYLIDNFGPLSSLIDAEPSDDKTTESSNPVQALKEYLKNIC